MNPTEKDLSKLSTITAAITLYPENYANFIGYARSVGTTDFLFSALNELERELRETLDLQVVVSNLRTRNTTSSVCAARALSWNMENKSDLL